MRPTVAWCSEAMAMPMRLHRGVLGQGKPPSPAPSKERPFLPRLKDGGILARFGDQASYRGRREKRPAGA